MHVYLSPGAFAPAVPSDWNVLLPKIHKAGTLSWLMSLLKYHIPNPPPLCTLSKTESLFLSLFFLIIPFHLALFFFITLITDCPDIVYLFHNTYLCVYFLSPQLELRFPDGKDFDFLWLYPQCLEQCPTPNGCSIMFFEWMNKWMNGLDPWGSTWWGWEWTSLS